MYDRRGCRPDLLANVQEERDVDRRACLKLRLASSPVERSPCNPGSVYSITSSTLAGSSMYNGEPSWTATFASWFSRRYFAASPYDCLRHEDLIVGVVVHEHEVSAVAVEVLHRALVDGRRLYL